MSTATATSTGNAHIHPTTYLSCLILLKLCSAGARKVRTPFCLLGLCCLVPAFRRLETGLSSLFCNALQAQFGRAQIQVLSTPIQTLPKRQTIFLACSIWSCPRIARTGQFLHYRTWAERIFEKLEREEAPYSGGARGQAGVDFVNIKTLGR